MEGITRGLWRQFSSITFKTATSMVLCGWNRMVMEVVGEQVNDLALLSPVDIPNPTD